MILENNHKNLNKIDSLIENDLKNDMRNFNPDRNEEIRKKLINSNEIFIPNREKRVENIVDNFIEIFKVSY